VRITRKIEIVITY